MANRRASWRTVKGRRSYDVAEAAAAVGVSTATVRAWRKAGLEAVAGIRPAIFRGVDLITFLKERSTRRKQPCGLGRMFCFGCKEPQVPAFGEVEFWPTGPKLGFLRGLCPVCATIMQRRASRESIARMGGQLRISIKHADSHLSETAKPR